MWKKWLLSVTLVSLIGGAQLQHATIKESSETEDGVQSETTDYTQHSIGCDEIPPSVPSKEKSCIYMLSILSVLRSGETAQACLKVQSEESVKVTVTFHFLLSYKSVFNTIISPGSNFFECKDFPVPKVQKQEMAYLTLSISGETVNIEERKSVIIDKMPENCFTQTDKSLYLPGETVKVRMFCVNFNLKPIAPNCSRITLVDPNGARLAQILDPKPRNSLIAAEFPISDNAVEGHFRIEFERNSDYAVSKYIQVKTYIPPRFDSTVICTNNILVSEKSAEIEVSAKYVYNLPLNGSVIGTCRRQVKYLPARAQNCLKGVEDISFEFTAELDSSGKHTEILDMSMFRPASSEYSDFILCTVTVKETGTEILDTKTCSIYISRQEANLQFDYTNYNSYYKNGLLYHIAVTLTKQNGDPMPNETIIIEVDGEEVKKVQTDSQGIAKCGIDTSSYFQPNYTIRASFQREDQCYWTDQESLWVNRGFAPHYPYSYSPNFPYTDMTIFRAFAETNCFLQLVHPSGTIPCNQIFYAEVQYKLTKAGIGEGKTSVTFYYMLKSRQSIVRYGQQTVDLPNCLKGTFKVPLSITAECAHSAELIIVGLMNSEIITDSMRLNVENCFKNQVSLTFAKPIVKPGEKVQQNITGAPGSICAVKSWDASLDLLSSNNDLTADVVYNGLLYYAFGLQFGNIDLREPKIPCEDANTETFFAGRYHRITSSTTDSDAKSILEEISLVTFTNLKTQKAQVCGMEEDNNVFYTPESSSGLSRFKAFATASDAFTTVRSNFFTSFSFMETFLGSEGKGSVTDKCPDTVTTWKSTALCISEKEGVGIVKETAEMIAMLVFFIEMSSASQCTRGEYVFVDIIAVNNMNKCIEPAISLIPSDGFRVISSSNDEESCICQGERTTNHYLIEFTKFGVVEMTASATTISISDTCGGVHDKSQPLRNDTVKKNVTVQAEGMPREQTTSWQFESRALVDVRNLTVFTPDNVVNDTEKTWLTIVGDFVGLGFAHIRNVLLQPDGCCEQKMAKLFCILEILDYCEYTGTVLGDFYKEAIYQLTAGYQRLLGCRSPDGQISVFSGKAVMNYWLQVLMMDLFMKMQKYTYVDIDLIPPMLLQLAQHQNLSTGCFNPIGSPFNYQDKTNENVCFTAFVCMKLSSKALREKSEPLLKGARKCIEAANVESLDTYTLCHVFYCSSLTNQENIWNRASAELQRRAIVDGGRRYWSPANVPTGQSSRCSSARVDITALVLKAYLRGPTVDKNYCSPIAAYLSSCRNSKGGYTSSKDTVSACEAMTAYGKLIYVNETNCEVVGRHEGTELFRKQLTNRNKYLVHAEPLPIKSGDITISVSGTCAPLIQVTTEYNTKIINERSPFTLVASAWAERCTGGVADLITINFTVIYRGDKPESQMVLMSIFPFTGYSPDLAGAYQLQNNEQISMYQYQGNMLYLYWNSLKNNTKTAFTLNFYMQNRVQEYRRGMATVGEYYVTGEEAFVTFTHPCSPKVVG